MSAGPLVSVIVPTRNRRALLARAIASVLAQRYTKLELIVVNDGSTDGTREFLDANADPRLRAVHRSSGTGAAAARNAGIAIARGELLAFCDDDDFWLVDKLDKQVAMLRASPGVRWCIASYIRLTPKRAEFVGGQRFIRELDYRRGLGEYGADWALIATSGWLVDRELLSGAGAFDERIGSWDDWELGLRMGRLTDKVFADEPLWVQDWQQGGGLTRLERVRARDLRIFVEKHADVWKDLRRVRAQHWYVIGRTESLYDPAPAGRAELFRSLRLDPFRAKTWAAIAMAYLGAGPRRRMTEYARRLKEALR